MVVGEIHKKAVSYGIAVNPTTNLVYIGDPTKFMFWSDKVHVYDGETLKGVTSVEIPGSSEVGLVEHVGVAVNLETNRVYVTWSYFGRLFVVDGDTHEIIKTVVCLFPFSMNVMVNPHTNYVYVGYVALDGETLEEVVSEYQRELKAINPLYNLLYSVRTGGKTLYVLDGNSHKIGATLKLGEDISDLAVNIKTGRIYVIHPDTKQISVVQGPLSLHPAEFVVSSLTVEPERVDVGKPSTVTVNVTNAGDLEGSHTIKLEVAGIVVDAKNVTLAGRESTTVIFEVSKEEPGNYEVEIDGQRGTITVKKGCIIATATYGSELSPEVQFLRGFRDNTVLTTFAGSNFMTAFNGFYYSFSPSVASIISGNEVLRDIMKMVLYPLMGILHLSSVAFSIFGFNSELGAVLAGLVASSLIGIIYFLPLALILSLVKKVKVSAKTIRLTGLVWAGSIIAIVVAEVTKSPLIMMMATGVFVLATISAATLTSLRIVSKRLIH